MEDGQRKLDFSRFFGYSWYLIFEALLLIDIQDIGGKLMDITTLAEPFATIVSLISSFLSGRTGKVNYQEFKEWLEKNHQEFVNLITVNNQIVGEIEEILKADHARLDEIFRQFDDFLAFIASGIDETKGLVKVVKGVQLRQQPFNILKQLVDSNGSRFIKMPGPMGKVELLILEVDEYIDISDDKFLKDDLKTLVDYEFLILDSNKKGEDVYSITRNGYDFIKIRRD